MMRIVMLLSLLVSLCLTGCGGGGGGSDSSTSTPPSTPSASTADFAKTWTVVVDGDLYATVIFNGTGTMTSDTVAGWTSGTVVVGSGSAFTVTEIAGTVTTTFVGTIAADKNSMSGTFSRTGGSPSSGTWSATVQGQALLTNADLVGAWAFTTNGSNYTTITFAANGTVSVHGSPDYVASSGRVTFTGGLGLRYSEQVLVTLSGPPVTVTRTFVGTMAAGKASMLGSYTGVDATATMNQSGPWTAAKPITLADLAFQWEVLLDGDTSTGIADWGFNADGSFSLLQDADAIVAQSSASITSDYRVVVTIKRNGSAPGEIITVIYTGTMNGTKDQMSGTYTATSSAGGGRSGTWTASKIPSGST
jgi:hypothetical protein